MTMVPQFFLNQENIKKYMEKRRIIYVINIGDV